MQGRQRKRFGRWGGAFKDTAIGCSCSNCEPGFEVDGHFQLRFSDDRSISLRQRRPQDNGPIRRRRGGQFQADHAAVAIRGDDDRLRLDADRLARQHDLDADGAVPVEAALDGDRDVDRFAGMGGDVRAARFHRELAGADDGDDLLVLVRRAERDAVLAAAVLHGPGPHHADAARSPHLHPRRQVRLVDELALVDGDDDRRPGDSLKMASLLVGEPDLDRALEAVPLDLVLSGLPSAPGRKAHLVFPLDHERGRQPDSNSQRLGRALHDDRRRHRQRLSLLVLRGNRCADDANVANDHWGRFVGLQRQLDGGLIRRRRERQRGHAVGEVLGGDRDRFLEAAEALHGDLAIFVWPLRKSDAASTGSASRNPGCAGAIFTR